MVQMKYRIDLAVGKDSPLILSGETDDPEVAYRVGCALQGVNFYYRRDNKMKVRLYRDGEETDSGILNKDVLQQQEKTNSAASTAVD